MGSDHTTVAYQLQAADARRKAEPWWTQVVVGSRP